MRSRFLFTALAGVCVLYSATVDAQVFLTDPRVSEGLGVQAGSFTLHPGLAAEGGYDSNYFQTAHTNAEPTISAYRLRITPSLSFESYGQREEQEGNGPPPALALHGLLDLSYNALFPGSCSPSASCPSDSTVSNDVTRQSNVSGFAGAGLDILPERPVGGDVFADYTRTVEASNTPETANAFRRDIIHAGAGVSWRPGGGLFHWRVGYEEWTTLFEQGSFQSLNNVEHFLQVQNRWLFLPRTEVFFHGNMEWVNYLNHPATANDGHAIRGLLGLNGLFSNHFGALAAAGWGASFLQGHGAVPGENFDSVIAQAEATWYPAPQKKLPEGKPIGLSTLSIGYVRNFDPSYLGNYVQWDRGYLKVVYMIGGRFVMSLVGAVERYGFPPAYFANGDFQQDPNRPNGSGFSEMRLDGTGFFEYRPGDAFGINLTVRYNGQLTKVQLPIEDPRTAGGPVLYDDLRYQRYQILGGIRWFL